MAWLWLLGLLLSPAALAQTELPPALFDDESPALILEDQPDQELPRFLPVSEAFMPVATQTGEGISIRFDIADGYYLYKDRMALKSPDKRVRVADLAFSKPGKVKVDEYFGEVEVFYEEVTVSAEASPLASTGGDLLLTYQGCADAGLCYPPETLSIPLIASASAASLAGNTEPSAPRTELDSESASSVSRFLSESSLFWVVMMFFALGIGLSFTPCVFPMIPILSGIIAGQKNLTTTKAFSLSLSYVLGMAITYAILGVVVASLGAGANIQAYMQEPWILTVFAALFVALALAMFDFYQLQLPESLRDRLNRSGDNQGGTLLGAAIMGLLSAVVVSPCVSAPLAGALLYISTTGDTVLGGLALLALGLGMGTPLMIIGTGGGKLLPRAGVWMETVKNFFGVALLAVAIWMLERILPAQLTLGLWSLLLGVYAVYLGAFDTVEPVWNGWQRLKKGIGLLMFTYSIMLLAGALAGGNDPLKPLAAFQSAQASMSVNPASEKLAFQTVTDLTSLEDALALARERRQPAFIDVYADWCISCKIMEREVLNAPGVREELAQMALIKMDVTDTNPQTRALLNRYGLFGPPAYLFYNREGLELPEARIMGEMGLAAFSAHLNDQQVLR